MRRFFIISAAALALASCASKNKTEKETIGLVSDILTEASSREYRTLRNFSLCGAQGPIAIIDESSRAAKLSSAFVSTDRHDNITGSFVRDYLPDFAGERFDCIKDTANAPYAQYVAEKNFLLLREITLCNAISSLDTTYFAKTFTDIIPHRKPQAKAIIMSSPYAAAYGQYDIQKLMERSGCQVPVLFPAAMAARKALEMGCRNIAVICDANVAEQSIYSAILSEMTSDVPKTVSFTPEGPKREIVSRLLDRYIASGRRDAIDAIIVDDLTVSTADEVSRAVMIMHADKTLQNHNYLKFLSPDLKIISTAAEAIDGCYDLMRERNIFSHRIAQPDYSDFVTTLSEDITDKSGRSTARGSYSLFDHVQNQR